MKLLSLWSRHRAPSLPQLRRRVATIESLESSLQSLGDEALNKQARSLRYRVRSGEPLDELLEEGFALVREAARRTIGLRHHDVQLIGGLAMHFGCVVEMQTGEGKTLTATLPTALAAMIGRGAHVATANDYLARRDAQEMTPVYELLGLTLGVVQSQSSPSQRHEAYQADITYGTAKEFGFDFLRQRLKQRSDASADSTRMVARERDSRYFMLVDEADALLLDEARTPLIVSSDPEGDEHAWETLHQWAYSLSCELEEGRHFEWTADHVVARLTAAGRRQVRSRVLPSPIADVPTIDLYERVELGLLVRFRYQRDRHYVVRDDEVVIVDEFTGRLSEGRRWKDGIHQMIETREQVSVSPPTGQAARITLQRFLSLYDRLAGMTGTAANSGPELRSVYELDVLKVPTHRPPKRKRLEDLVFGTAEEKLLALVDEVITVHAQHRPVLIGTRTIDVSHRISELLSAAGIPHEVLNAHHVEAEAAIVEKAGRRGAVTVATNMAGRGTDIRLEAAAYELGGLLVLGTEMHESLRIDRQLIGRCGRQGDPGAFRQYLSLEDELLKSGLGRERASRLMIMGQRTFGPIKGASQWFRRAQAIVERKHYRQRKQLLDQERDRHQMLQSMGLDPFLDSSE